MKKFLSLVMLCCVIVSCTKEEENDTAYLVTGSWEFSAESTTERDIAVRFVFNKDNTFSKTTYYRNSITGDILGYIIYSTGTYTAVDNELTINTLELYEVIDQPNDYVEDIEDLELNPYTGSYTVDYILQNNGNTLIFDYGPCADTENCVGDLTLQKVSPN